MRFGRVILSTTSVYSVYSTKGLWDFKNMLNTLIITLKAAIFGTIAINAAKSEFEPSYTSGTQEILNPKAAIKNVNPAKTRIEGS